jgi:hypothetical protein
MELISICGDGISIGILNLFWDLLSHFIMSPAALGGKLLRVQESYLTDCGLRDLSSLPL